MIQQQHGYVGGGNVPYGHTQGYGAPPGAQGSNINGYQIGEPAPAQRGQRARSRSNVGTQLPPQYQNTQNSAGSIPGWARGVQAAQSNVDSQPRESTISVFPPPHPDFEVSDRLPAQLEQQYQQYAPAPIQNLGSTSVPQDPGPRPVSSQCCH